MRCEEVKNWLESKGFKVTFFREDARVKSCTANFILPKDEEFVRKVVGLGYTWYVSGLDCNVETEDCDVNLNKIVRYPKEFVEVYIPEECGKEFCRIHVDFDMKTENPKERVGRVGFEIRTIKWDRLKDFILNFIFQ